eukprot:COSAG02_NODE_565_length_20246_cov_13.930163_5_plen_91_part_00
MSLNFFGTYCAQVFNFPSCPNVRNTHGPVGSCVVVPHSAHRTGDVATLATTLATLHTVRGLLWLWGDRGGPAVGRRSARLRVLRGGLCVS